MKCKYEKLMSPVKVGGTMLKNRLINTPHDIHFIQGSEQWPTEAVILWLAERAKNGCATLRPLKSGAGIRVTAEAENAEIAEELCGFYAEKILRLSGETSAT